MVEARKSFLFSIIVSTVFTFDPNIKVSHLAGCREIVLDGSNTNSLTVPISSLSNNQGLPNELLRMRLFALEHDFYIFFKETENATYNYKLVISGWENTKCAIQYNPAGNYLTIVDCANLQDDFYYSEFTLILTKDGLIQLFKSKEINPFIFAKVNLPLPYLSFGKLDYTTQKIRLLFDCPANI
ncbi:hypothetical protein ACFFRR_007688 [Megaselia abdita]